MIPKNPCKHRIKEYCDLTERACVGTRVDKKTGSHTVDFWVECSCPNYKSIECSDISHSDKGHSLEKNTDIEIILFGPIEKQDQCNTGCVNDAVDLQADILHGFFQRRYGDKIRVKGIDIASETARDYPAVSRFIKNGVSHLVMINNEIKFQGGIDLEYLKQEIIKLGGEEIKS